MERKIKAKKRKTKKIKRKGPKIVTVHSYPRHVKVSKKNPNGIGNSLVISKKRRPSIITG